MPTTDTKDITNVDLPSHRMSADELDAKNTLSPEKVEEYKLTVVKAIEDMLARDAGWGRLADVTSIHVDDITLDGLLVLDRVSPEEHAEIKSGGSVAVPFIAAGEERVFIVKLVHDLDGFGTYDENQKLILPLSKQSTAA